MELFKLGENENSIRYRIKEAGKWLSFQEVFSRWGTDPEFREFYLKGLSEVPFPAFFWEHPGLKSAFLPTPYEFILHKSRNLDRLQPNPESFEDHFKRKTEIARFQNLGRNAILLSPAPLGEDEDYPHFARFLRSANETQKHQLFIQISKMMETELFEDKTRWLSTAGMGVAWLHIRLDSRPKYYRSQVYKNPEFLGKVLRKMDPS